MRKIIVLTFLSIIVYLVLKNSTTYKIIIERMASVISDAVNTVSGSGNG